MGHDPTAAVSLRSWAPGARGAGGEVVLSQEVASRAARAAAAFYRWYMNDTLTPRELASELGVSDRAIRQWLRQQGWQSVRYARWHLTQEQAALVRAHFRN